jgi:hypothetical protein
MGFRNSQTDEVWRRISMLPAAYDSWMETARNWRVESHVRPVREILAERLEFAFKRATGVKPIVIDWFALADRLIEEEKTR